jgi:hypothetical protein
MPPKIKSIAIQIQEKVLALFFGAKVRERTQLDHLLYDQRQPTLLYRPPLTSVLLIHQGEPIDLLVSIKSSIQLKSKEGHEVIFRREGAFLVIQSKGLELESK